MAAKVRPSAAGNVSWAASRVGVQFGAGPAIMDVQYFAVFMFLGRFAFKDKARLPSVKPIVQYFTLFMYHGQDSEYSMGHAHPV
ncbi:hypothetical protein [Mesoterricola sediminis]|uniref:hypothetical protein n=1 Tax=Mesoterricola sediminis TaxID=2927980 RepID=UPI001FAE8882|nr:hypothetical protein [Mesoterricola sediminis]